MNFLNFKKKKNNGGTALVLGSGGARGFAHLGVLKAFDDHKIPIDMIVGTSMGGFIGGFYAAGNSAAKLIAQMKSGEWRAVLSFIDPVKDLSGLIGGTKIEKLLQDSFGEMKFEELNIPLTVVCTDILRGEMVTISKGNLANGLRATISVPGLFKPAMYEDRFLVDGGVVNPLPVDMAKSIGASTIIAVDVSINAHRYYEYIKAQRVSKLKKKKQNKKRIISKIMDAGAFPEKFKTALMDRLIEKDDPVVSPHALDIIFQTIYTMESEIVKSKLKETSVDYIIKPEIDNVSATDFERAEEIVRLGEKAAIKAVPHIKKTLGIR